MTEAFFSVHHSVIFMISVIIGLVIGYFVGRDNAEKIEKNLQKLRNMFKK